MPLSAAEGGPVRILLIGYGNPGRGDDGLGPALAEAIAALGLEGVTVEADYQLTVDHAATIAEHDLVIFADAMIGLAEPYRLSGVEPDRSETMGSHQVSPAAALRLADLLFGHAPRGVVLAIAGEEFGEVREGLGAEARRNLALATEFLGGWIRREARAGS